MALADALLAAAASWPRLSERLGPEESQSVRRALAAAVHGAAWDPGELLATLLAHEPQDGPAWQALTISSERRTMYERPSVTYAAMRLRLAIEISAAESGQIGPDRSQDADEVERAAEQRIWNVPMRPLPETRTSREYLVILERDGRELAPAFQLDREGRVLQTAAEVNRLLDASEDPWGAASWWLTPHAALHAIPADALRTGEEQNVLAAAVAAGDLD